MHSYSSQLPSLPPYAPLTIQSPIEETTVSSCIMKAPPALVAGHKVIKLEWSCQKCPACWLSFHSPGRYPTGYWESIVINSSYPAVNPACYTTCLPDRMYPLV